MKNNFILSRSKMKNIKFLAIVLIVFTFCSCNLFNTHHNDDITENIPVVTNVEDAYTYTVNAEAFSDSTREVLNFNSNEAVLTYTVLEYSEGSIQLEIDNADTLIIYTDLIESNLVIVEDLNDKPMHIELVLNNFSGMFELALANDN